MRIVAYVPDLMDRSRLAGVEGVTFVATPDDLVAATADIVVVDLSRPGVMAVMPSLVGVRTIGFGSHVDRQVLDEARAAGCDEVLPRSAFFSRLSELLA